MRWVLFVCLCSTSALGAPEHVVGNEGRVVYTRGDAGDKYWKFTPNLDSIRLKIGDHIIIKPPGKELHIQAERGCRRHDGGFLFWGGEWIPWAHRNKGRYAGLGYRFHFLAGHEELAQFDITLDEKPQHFVAPRPGRLLLEEVRYPQLDDATRNGVTPCTGDWQDDPGEPLKIKEDQAAAKGAVAFSYVVCEAATADTGECK